jgi:hypothetical protein
MTPDEIDAALKRIFPGDPVPDVQDDDDGVVWVQRESQTRARGPRLATYTAHVEPDVESPRLTVAARRARAEQFARIVEQLPPAPSVPQRQHLLDAAENVVRWLDEARAIESDVKLGQAAEPHRVTRLMLEAIPVVEQWRKRDGSP